MRELTFDEVVELHAEVVARYGGDPTVPPHAKGIESALYTATYQEGELGYAAAILFYIAKAQHFTDGNKRTAYAACLRALELNGYTLVVNDQVAFVFVLSVVNEKGMTISDVADCLAEWIEEL